MSKLTVDYISDMHLSFYLQATSNGYDVKQMESFIAKNIPFFIFELCTGP
jgi:hypothetical protein